MNNPPTTEVTSLWPLAVYFAAVVLIVTVMLALSSVLGQRHRERATAEPYESGIVSTGTARVRFDVKFYLIAMFFVIFDLEAIFVYAWAVAIRETDGRGTRRCWSLSASCLPRWSTSGASARWTGEKDTDNAKCRIDGFVISHILNRRDAEARRKAPEFQYVLLSVSAVDY